MAIAILRSLGEMNFDRSSTPTIDISYSIWDAQKGCCHNDSIRVVISKGENVSTFESTIAQAIVDHASSMGYSLNKSDVLSTTWKSNI